MALVADSNEKEVAIDHLYEFDAPRFFDFVKNETPEEAAEAQKWFKTAPAYAASPHVKKTKPLQELSLNASLVEYVEAHKLLARMSMESSVSSILTKVEPECWIETKGSSTKPEEKSSEVVAEGVSGSLVHAVSSVALKDMDCPKDDFKTHLDSIVKTDATMSCSSSQSLSSGTLSTKDDNNAIQPSGHEGAEAAAPSLDDQISNKGTTKNGNSMSTSQLASSLEAWIKTSESSENQKNCEPKSSLQILSSDTLSTKDDNNGIQPSGHEGTEAGSSLDDQISNKGTTKNDNSMSTSQIVSSLEEWIKASKSSSMTENQKKCEPKRIQKAADGPVKRVRTTQGHPDEHQKRKKQRLDNGMSRQICISNNTPALTVPKGFNFRTEERAHMHKESGHCNSASKDDFSCSPFMSMAERIQRFQMSISQQSCNQDVLNILGNKPLKLTRPKEPKLETSLRARPPRVKSFIEQEEEMLENMPKFKPRPLIKKILEAPTLPPLPRSTPELPEFKEFNLRTMERALVHRSTSLASETTQVSLKPSFSTSTERFFGNIGEPHLATAARARPSRFKSTEEMEEEELAKVPQFKARPLNKRVLSSRGDLGIVRAMKKQATQPQEFKFATDERIPNRTNGQELKKLQLFGQSNSRPYSHFVPRLTKPEPFHFRTDGRGEIKQTIFQMQFGANKENDTSMRIPKANPIPYTTDFYVMPPKPAPREATRPEPFNLESVLRHEREQQHMMEEHLKAERRLQESRVFHAHPINWRDSYHVPEMPKRMLTEVQPFVFRAESRAIERSEFDKMVNERRTQSRILKEEYEAARWAEEERLFRAKQKEQMFKARPVPDYSTPFVPFRSSTPLTQPASPNFHFRNPNEHRKSSNAAMQLFSMR